MFILPVSNANFTGGNINLKNINPKNLCNYESIKKIAEEKDMDIFISQNNKSKFLPYEKIYTITASKNTYKATREFDKKIRGVAFAIMSKRAGIEETSVRIYNAVMMAIEALNNKIKN